MAIAETGRQRTVFGNKTVLFITGTFADNDSTGDISTGLSAIDFVIAQYIDAAFILNATVAAGVVTLATQDTGGTKTWKMMVVGH